MNIFRSVLIVFFTVVGIVFPNTVLSAETAGQMLQRASKKITAATGIQASFKMTGGASASGTFYMSGKKFSLISNVSSSWYNGKNLWTYNPSSRETTLVIPTVEELQESNPMMYVSGASKFNASFASKSPAGQKTIILTPKRKGTGVKRVDLSLNQKSLIPSKIVIYPLSGGAVTLSLTNVKIVKKFSDSVFIYPSAKYKGVTVVDLR